MNSIPTAATSIPAAPRTTLTNGLRVVNFSSPHGFEFVDGSKLERCHPDRVAALSLNPAEKVIQETNGIQTIRLGFEVNQTLMDEVDRLQADETVDIVLVPFAMLSVLRSTHHVENTKVRTIRTASRETKLILIDKFCI